MDIQAIREMIALMQEMGLSELEVEESGKRIRIGRVVSASMPPGVAEAGVSTPSLAPRQESGHMVRSPIVGSFYRAPSPGIPPYVEQGSPIKKGQTLCIVETMKLMNEIEADIDGRIAEIYVEDGARVGYGTPLFRIDPL